MRTTKQILTDERGLNIMSLIKIKLLSKQVNVGSKKFRRYFTPVKIVVKGEEEKGKQSKSLTVKFAKSCKLPDKVNFAIITADVSKGQISVPTLYEITEDKDGNTIYPVIWLRGFEDCKPLQPKADLSNIDFELGDDADDNEEIEIKDNEVVEE